MKLQLDIEGGPTTTSFPNDGADLVAFMSFAVSRGFGAVHPLIALADRLHDVHGVSMGPLTTFYETEPADSEDREKLELAWQGAEGLLTALERMADAFESDEQLGIYRTMAGAGPMTSSQLATKSGLNERFLREWLRGQAGAGILDYRGEGRFELSPETALVIADESTPASTIGFFTGLPDQINACKEVITSFKTGIGYNYDAGGPEMARGVERGFAPWYRAALVESLKAGLGAVIGRLEAGGKVADIGCGSAVATIEMAKAWPKSEFHGYDNSLHALSRAAANAKAAGVTNVTFHNPDQDPLPADGSFDLICCFDCLHDMTRPDLVGAAVHKALKADGTWFIKDIACAPTFEDNLAMNPMAGMLYSVSVLTCMASSASTADGLALGTLGLPAPEMEKLVRAAGFGHFEVAQIEATPLDAFYIARR